MTGTMNFTRGEVGNVISIKLLTLDRQMAGLAGVRRLQGSMVGGRLEDVGAAQGRGRRLQLGLIRMSGSGP